MNNLQQRTLTGILFVCTLVGSIAIGKWTFFVLFILISYLATNEFYHLAYKAKARPNRKIGIATSIYIFISFFLVASGMVPSKVTLGIIPLIVGLFVYELYRDSKVPFLNLAFTLLGLVYVTTPLALFNFFVFPPEGEAYAAYSPYLLMGIFIFIWTNDSGAYLFGSQFGKHKLFERISPKKTWEGSIGGGVMTMIAAVVLSYLFPQYKMVDMLVVALITVVAGTLGDLVESMFKRSIDVKDSGSFFPGHGGLLDRFDSVILAAPMVYFYIRLIS
ncbi:phosphatidate cytidylyltransferase [Halosquirtibacter xylanolyticus]|uniref:phosphatidate cytidylyltransferase n=1 Tax=Halosquirtibacter xylanolyticus TaxID=3374599 RepID=UPI003747D1FA|nr:phosphatidate cytidylyltransferase [Prolixibacteraceae bacterium]